MNSWMKASTKVLLQAVSFVLLAIAAISFLMGGWVLAEFYGMSRFLGEAIGIGVAVACGIAGALIRPAKESAKK